MTKTKQAEGPSFTWSYGTLRLRSFEVRCGKESVRFVAKTQEQNIRIPEPNDNFSMIMGNKAIVDAVFSTATKFITDAMQKLTLTVVRRKDGEGRFVLSNFNH